MNSGDLCFVCWNVSPENECTSNTARAEIKQAPPSAAAEKDA